MYHYGITIREYREQAKMTQQQLADRWPKSERFGGGEGVTPTYVQDIEHGRKRIDDPQTLRKVCDILPIPYWKVGISEYDPFNETVIPGRGKSMYTETLNVIETLVRQIWSLRCAARISEADKGVKQLGKLFAYFNESLPPPIRLEKRYVFLYVQYLRLKATTYLEKKQYDASPRGNTMQLLARSYIGRHRAQDFDTAIKKAEEIAHAVSEQERSTEARSTGNQFHLGHVYEEYAKAYDSQQNWQLALDYVDKSEKAGPPIKTLEILLKVARAEILIHSGDLRNGEPLAVEAALHSRKHGHYRRLEGYGGKERTDAQSRTNKDRVGRSSSYPLL